jgi:hypothetical protein
MELQYDVLAAHTIKDVDSDQCIVVEHFERLSAAKERAKYVLTDEYRCRAELKCPLGYARVVRTCDGECVVDFFRE